MDIKKVICTICNVEKEANKSNFYYKKEGRISSRKCKMCISNEARIQKSKFNFLPNIDESITHKCYTCLIEMPHTEKYFNRKKTNKKGLTYRCRECNNKKANEHRKKNPKKERNSFLKSKYGISIEDYNRILQKQGGCCFICEIKSEDYFSIYNKRLAVDHCHITGVVRGVLCCQCNRSLGLLKDNIDNLQRAIKYLKKNK